MGRPLNYSGWEKIIKLIDEGKQLENIVDRYGHPIDSNAEEFTQYHKQAKRMIIKHLITNRWDRDRIINEVFQRDE